MQFSSISAASYVDLYANYKVAHRVEATSANWTHVEFPYTTGNDDRMLQFVFSFVLGDEMENEVWVDKVAMDVVATSTSTSISTSTTPVIGAATIMPVAH